MKTYVEVFFSANGEKASVISEKLNDIGLIPTIGEHDHVYKWKENVAFSEVLKFIDRVQSKLKGTGVILKFSTFR
jgi:hypothetical protein